MSKQTDDKQNEATTSATVKQAKVIDFKKPKTDAPVFVHARTNAKGDVTGYLCTLENFAALLKHLNIEFKYNEITTEYDVFFKNVYQSARNKYPGIIYSAAKKYGMQLSKNEMDLYVDSVALIRRYNPWKELLHGYIKKHRDEIDTLKQYKTIRQAFECLQINIDYEADIDFLYMLFKKFLLHFIANVKLPDYGSNGVLVLQGPQNDGKTGFFRALVPEGYFKEGVIVNTDSKDSVREALRYLLTELGEMEGTFKKSDVNKLKNFVTERVFAFRRQFSTFIEEHKRYTVLCGTCNTNSFLRDESGDRRYWVIPVNGIDFDKLNNIDLDILWAEVYYLFMEEEEKIPLEKSGIRRRHCHELTKEESARLISNNKVFTHVTPLDDLLDATFDWSSSERYYISAQMLANVVFQGKGISSEAIGRALNKKEIPSERSRKIYKVTTSTVPNYYLLPKPVGTTEDNKDTDFVEKLKLVKIIDTKRRDELVTLLGEAEEEWEN